VAEGEDPVKRGPVIGVVRDFHFKSLHHAVEPLVIHIYPRAFGMISVRLRPGQVPATLDRLEATWKKWAPEWPFTYEFVDASFDAFYRAEAKLSRLVTTFSLLAVFVACLGLFGLASFMAERRRKEIGVRKVLGASVPGLVVLLAKDFAALVAVAFVVAAPLAYLAMGRWLEDFTYRIEMSGQLGLFALAGLAALAAALVSVAYQSTRAARTDPVDSLRYE
jgi:putative ABC transport system permease protein